MTESHRDEHTVYFIIRIHVCLSLLYPHLNWICLKLIHVQLSFDNWFTLYSFDHLISWFGPTAPHPCVSTCAAVPLLRICGWWDVYGRARHLPGVSLCGVRRKGQPGSYGESKVISLTSDWSIDLVCFFLDITRLYEVILTPSFTIIYQRGKLLEKLRNSPWKILGKCVNLTVEKIQ